jgi:hypothetical protein
MSTSTSIEPTHKAACVAGSSCSWREPAELRDPLARELAQNGIVILHDLLRPEQLHSMQETFAARLHHPRWNDMDGYEKTELYRHMVQDVLTLDQGFVDLALHPRVVEAIREYVGPRFELVEAKGWKSLRTKRDFHGWHGDAWYDQEKIKGWIPREVKLALYLTDVRSGAFKYIKGSHGKQVPRTVARREVEHVPQDQVIEVLGKAGTAFLFDTSGIHRQSCPILEERHAIFLNYHDPSVPLQQEDVAYYRYHPLLLNAAFLGNLSDEERRILGFGNKTNYIPGFQREPKHRWFRACMRAGFDLKLHLSDWRQRLVGKLKRLVGLGKR